jgi:hypothetical protein
MGRKRTTGLVPLPTDRTLQDQEFQDRLLIAERLVRILREAGSSCELGDIQAVKRFDTAGSFALDLITAA